MSTETNKALARRWIEEVWNKGELSLIEELIAPNYVLHDPIRPGLKGREGIKYEEIGDVSFISSTRSHFLPLPTLEHRYRRLQAKDEYDIRSGSL